MCPPLNRARTPTYKIAGGTCFISASSRARSAGCRVCDEVHGSGLEAGVVCARDERRENKDGVINSDIEKRKNAVTRINDFCENRIENLRFTSSVQRGCA